MRTDRIQAVKNYLYPTDKKDTAELINKPGSKNPIRNVGQSSAPTPISRLKQDVLSWREATKEIERPVVPFRFKIQQLFLDTVLNSQVKACMDRRKDLTMMRDFKICNEKGVGSDDLKSIFRDSTLSIGLNEQSTHWNDALMSYCLDAPAYGYSLISLGDLINSGFPQLTVLKRWLISPDRFVYSAFPYSVDGVKFLESPYNDWHIYVPTPSNHGMSACGYGYLFEVAPYEILLRNNIGYNADFNEVFNMPLTVGSTTKTEGAERDAYEKSLSQAGSLRWLLKDEGQDTVEFIESHNVGSSYQSYESLSTRMEKNISKIILGHADAMDSIPGKLGGAQGGKKGVSPVDQAMAAKQSIDGIMLQNIYNSMVIPRLRKLGFKIPLNYHFEFLNDTEEQENKDKEVDLNTKYADMTLKYFQAGKQIDQKWLTEQTTIPMTDIPVQAAVEPKPL
jgi:hypothetical protein